MGRTRIRTTGNGTGEPTACGKSGFVTELRARTAARWLRAKGENTHPYYCVRCRYWHVGHGR